MLDKVVMLAGLAKLIEKFDLNDGSSKHGNTLRASVGENCVLKINLK